MKRREPLFSDHSIPWLVLGGIIAAFGLALLAQYGFGLAPCELCYWQRYAYGLAALIALLAILFMRKTNKIFWLSLLSLSLLAVAGIAFFHVGVEHKWWEGTSACGAASLEGASLADIEAAIEAAPLTRCDEATIIFLGQSMAFYNILYALLLSALSLYGALRRA